MAPRDVARLNTAKLSWHLKGGVKRTLLKGLLPWLDDSVSVFIMMTLWIALAYLVALLPALALAQNATFIAGFVNSLFTLGYGDFAEALVRINSTGEGQAILSELSSGGNFTVFVPSNQACEAFSLSSFTNPDRRRQSPISTLQMRQRQVI